MTELDTILDTLAHHRGFLLHTAAGLSDDDARRRPTASALSVGGIVKHVATVETQWIDFLERGPEVMAMTPEAMADHSASFELGAEETLAGAVAHYEQVAARTADVLRGLPSLDVGQPLPEAPWFEPGAVWSARRVALHILAETSQHAGHADIIRESIDGARTMG